MDAADEPDGVAAWCREACHKQAHEEVPRQGGQLSSHITDAVVPEGVAGVNPAHPARSGAIILDADAGLVERRREKLAIIGYATSSRDLAPFDDDTYETIGLNQLYRMIPRADFWADLHWNWNEENVEGTDHEGWIRDCGIPVLMTQRRDHLPTSVRFPIEDILVDIGVDYFTSTISLLLGWAIFQKYKEIALYGIDLVVGTEYEVQKASAEFLLGVAHGRGITVRLPPNCSLLRASHRYGYEKEPSWGLTKPSEFSNREVSLIKQRDELLAKLHALDGALHEVSTCEQWASDPAARLKWLSENRGDTMATLATIDGAAQETRFWKEMLTLRSRGADIRMQ